MEAFKKHLKLFIGISALILVAVGFFFYQKSSDLENDNMRHWATASLERRAAAVKILTGNDENTDLMVQCLDKVSTLPNSADMSVRDATSLCFMGIQLKDNI
ncbi:MAG: hypothetical protein JW974_00515 [Alphaproteobacteria bacterium]|nr:hypothetical protein [Alphaproteobacteria bacterium]MBN2675232.1 hypothetical protein [Alphaproteobacteria bacterium]